MKQFSVDIRTDYLDGKLSAVGGFTVKPVLNWVNVCSPQHTSDTSMNYDLFLN